MQAEFALNRLLHPGTLPAADLVSLGQYDALLEIRGQHHVLQVSVARRQPVADVDERNDSGEALFVVEIAAELSPPVLPQLFADFGVVQ